MLKSVSSTNHKSAFARFMCIACAVSMMMVATTASAIPEQPVEWPDENGPDGDQPTWYDGGGKQVKLGLIDQDPIEFPQEPDTDDPNAPTYSIFSLLRAVFGL